LIRKALAYKRTTLRVVHTLGMTAGRFSREPLRSRALILLGAVSSAVLVGLRVWAADRPGWPGFAALVAYVAVVGGFAVPVAVSAVRAVRAGSNLDAAAAFVVTPRGFAIRPAMAPGLLAAMLLSLLGMLAGPLVDDWRTVGRRASPLTVDTGFTIAMTVLLVLTAVLTASVVWYAWRAVPVVLTPDGIVSRAPWRRRLIPWTALAPETPPWVQYPNGPVHLVVARPELVVQRGGDALHGPRGRPILAADRHGLALAAAIRRYVEHPADQAAIGTSAELDRLVADLASAPASAPVAARATSAAPAAQPAAARRRLAIAATLVNVAVAVALLTAAAELAITIVFREELLAAERAIAATFEAPPDGGPAFTTDTVTFARAWAAVMLGATLLAGLGAIALARMAVRGSRPARIGLVVLAGVTLVVSACSLVAPVASLSAEPAAGALLNSWPAIRLLLSNLLVAGLAVVAMVLALTADAGPPRRALPAEGSP